MDRKRSPEDDGREAASGFTPLGAPVPKQPRVEGEEPIEEDDIPKSGVPRLPQGMGSLIGSYMLQTEKDAFIRAAVGNVMRRESASDAALSIAQDMHYHGTDEEWIEAAMRRGSQIPRVVNATLLAHMAPSAIILRYLERFPGETGRVRLSCHGCGRSDVLADLGEAIDHVRADYMNPSMSAALVASIFGKFLEMGRDMRRFIADLMYSFRTDALEEITSSFNITPTVDGMTLRCFRLNGALSYGWDHGARPIPVIGWPRRVGMEWGRMDESMWNSADVITFLHTEGYVFTVEDMILAVKRRSIRSILRLLDFGVSVPRIDAITDPETYDMSLRSYPLMAAWLTALANRSDDESELRAQVLNQNRNFDWVTIRHDYRNFF